MPGCAKHCWTASPIEPTFWKPARNRTDSAGRWTNRRKEENPRREPNSYGNDSPWKAWKAQPRLSTLPPSLEIPQNPRDFHIPSFDDCSFVYRSDLNPRPQTVNPRVGQIKLPKWAKCSCQTQPAQFGTDLLP